MASYDVDYFFNLPRGYNPTDQNHLIIEETETIESSAAEPKEIGEKSTATLGNVTKVGAGVSVEETQIVTKLPTLVSKKIVSFEIFEGLEEMTVEEGDKSHVQTPVQVLSPGYSIPDAVSPAQDQFDPLHHLAKTSPINPTQPNIAVSSPTGFQTLPISPPFSTQVFHTTPNHIQPQNPKLDQSYPIQDQSPFLTPTHQITQTCSQALSNSTQSSPMSKPDQTKQTPSHSTTKLSPIQFKPTPTKPFTHAIPLSQTHNQSKTDPTPTPNPYLNLNPNPNLIPDSACHDLVQDSPLKKVSSRKSTRIKRAPTNLKNMIGPSGRELGPSEAAALFLSMKKSFIMKADLLDKEKAGQFISWINSAPEGEIYKFATSGIEVVNWKPCQDNA